MVDIRRLQSFLVSLAWRRSTKTPGRIIQKRSKEKQLNRASRGVKEWKFSNGELNCSLEDVDSNKKFVPVTCYLSKSYC